MRRGLDAVVKTRGCEVCDAWSLGFRAWRLGFGVWKLELRTRKLARKTARSMEAAASCVESERGNKLHSSRNRWRGYVKAAKHINAM